MFTKEDNKVRDHDQVTGKHWGFAHWDCNIILKLTKKLSVIFNNLRVYDSSLTTQEIGKFNLKISVISNGLEKCMAFTINKSLVFINSMQFMNSSLDVLVKNLEFIIYQKNLVVGC